MENMEQTIKDCMIQYSGAVLQSRALVDVRDCLKPSARQIFYCMYTDKFTADKPFKKTLKAIGSAARMFIHGDSSCEGIIMRAGQPFAMRYPLIEVEGSEGNLTESGNWSAPRYTASRLSEVSNYLFEDIKKDTISEWRDNYDDTEQYPAVLPTKGFYNIVNGTFGIGVGLSASIPQFNLKEVNNALIKLIQNPNILDEEIICMPDFATGALLLNGNEVKQSLLNGSGSSCKLKSIINWNETEQCLIVTEIPYGVYTNTICKELEEILLDEENNPGIDRFNDLTGVNPLIKIYLNKKANYKKILEYLYKNTSLQYYFGINFTMLDNGRFPKVFTWKQALQAHIDHEKEIYRKGFEFDLAKIENRIHIIDGLLICLASIDEVVQVIKSAPSASAASNMLQIKFLLDEEQAKAVLALKLASLAKLEVKKLQDEKIKLTEEANRIKIILQNEKEFNQQLINGWEEVSRKFGDARRTKIFMEEPIDEKPEKILKEITILINLNGDYIVREGKSNLKSFKKGKVVYKMNGTTAENYYIFSNLGRCYCISGEKIFGESTGRIQELLKFEEKEEIIGSLASNMEAKVAFIVTKLGQIKKLSIEEIKSIKKDKTYIGLQEHDSVVDIKFGYGDEKVAIASQDGYIVVFEGDIISETKLPSKGVLGIKLKELTDEVVSMDLITNKTEFLCTITTKGFIKKTDIEEYPVTTRGTKGRLACKLNDDNLIEIITLNNNDSIRYSKVFNEINVEMVPKGARTARGTDILKM